ncbi:MAG: hypothetical protein ACI9JN_001057 [Bacteroidia bacterium]|jgi:hypothetical protein
MRLGRLLFMVFLLLGTTLQAQNLSIQRSQVNAQDWWLIESDHFNVFLSDSSTRLAKSIMPAAINKLNQIEEKIGYRLSGKIHIFVHASGAALNTTYSVQEGERVTNTGGITNIQNNDVHVYLTGKIPDLMDQISIGIADNLLLEMLYGGTVQERVKYAAMLNLPIWFQQGLVQYLAIGWTTDSDNLLRDAFNNQQFKSYNQLSEENQILVGQNMWLFVDDTKNKDAIQRILYLVRLTRKVETALYFVINKTSKQLYSEWYTANQAVYSLELKRRIPQEPERHAINPNEAHFIGSALSPNAKRIATAIWENGKSHVDYYNRDTDIKQKIIDQYSSYDGQIHVAEEMILKWKDNDHIFILTNAVVPHIDLYDLTGQHTLLHNFESFDFISGFDYYPVTGELVVSATKDGQSALYLFDKTFGKGTTVTASFGDDLQPHFDDNGNIYFTRVLYTNKDGKLKASWQTDIFYIFRNGSDVLSINNVTNTIEKNEEKPVKLNSKYLSYLSTENGIRNAYAYKLNQETFALSNYQTSILDQQINLDRTHVMEVVLHNGYLFTHISAVDSSQNFGAVLYPSKTKILQKVNEKIINAYKNNPILLDSTYNHDEDQVYFQSPFPVPHNIDSLDAISEEKLKTIDYTFKKVDKSHLDLRATKMITQFNNDNFLTDEFGAEYDPIKQMKNRIGLVGGLQMKDQFSNHVLEGKMRTTFNFSVFQYQLMYENRLGAIKEKITISTEQTRYNQNLDLGKRRMRSAKLELTKQLNTTMALQLHHRTQFDNFTPIVQDETFLALRDRKQLNLDNGLKFTYSTQVKHKKILHTGIYTQVNSTYRYNSSTGKSSLINTLEATYGKKLKGDILWNTRLQFGNSTGQSNTIFVLGGNRNQFRPTINDARISIDDAAFIKPVYGVRNFNINTRSGNTFGFVNTELWVPMHTYFGKRPLKSNLLQNLWLISFADVGTAWYGKSPKDKTNISNITTIEDGRLSITIFNARNPIIYSGGFGLRTTFFGYFMRYDLAWTYDNNVLNSRVSRVSLGRAF